MKRSAAIAIALFGALGMDACLLAAPNTALPHLTIMVSVPPARMVVQDRLGNLAGIDPGQLVDSNGMGSEINDIPEGETESVNVGSDDQDTLGRPGPTTGWHVSLYSDTAKSYSISVTGMVFGIANVSLIGMGGKGDRKSWGQELDVLVSPGSVRALRVVFDPVERSIAVFRIVRGSFLVTDIATACQMRVFGVGGQYIAPMGLCKSLTAKAEAFEADLGRGNRSAARGALYALLEELKAQGSKHIKEPALTILREEAEALLKTLPAIQKPKGAAKK